MKFEERLDRLRQLRHNVPDEALFSALRKSLRDRSNLIVAEAAKVAAELRISDLIPDLLAGFDRLFEDPVKTDPKCWGKTGIVKALRRLEYDQSPPFVRGSHHIQMEPVWGGQEDAAIQLRATCVLGFVQCSDLNRAELLRHLVDALADSADPVRLEAVRTLEQMNGEETPLLLRLKARLGDSRPIVMGHVFDALLNLERAQAVAFVAQHLKSSHADVRDEAALALGGSRLPDAVKILIEAWDQTRGSDFGSVLLRALSSSRQPPAIDFLLELVRHGPRRDALLALDALKLHESSPEILALVRQAKNERSDSQL
jgi:hypothetical protein